MAESIILYLQQSPDADRIGSLIAAGVPVTSTEYYEECKSAVKQATEAAADGKNVIIAVSASEFCTAKLMLLKALSVKILRSSKISAQLGDRLDKTSKEYNIQTAIPQDSETFVSADGLYSAFTSKSLKGKILLIPTDEYRLQEALDLGAAQSLIPPKNSKAKLAACLNDIVATGKKIAVADFGKAGAFMTAIESLCPEQTAFKTVTALTDAKLKAKNFEASLAKSAKETGDFDYGVVISNLDEKGVTVAVSDSSTGRVELIEAGPGEDAKKIMGVAVMRLCEMTLEATEEGIVIPEEKISGVSRSGFYIVISCLVAAIIACLAICILLFTKGEAKTIETTEAALTGKSEFSQMSEAAPTKAESTSEEVTEETGTTLLDLFDNYTTYKSGSSSGSANSVFTTGSVNYNDALFETTTMLATLFSSTKESDDGKEEAADTETSKPQIRGKFVFTVYGWGHGAGLSQDGAIALAKQGKSCNQILCHYYPGVTIMTDKNTPYYATEPNSEGKGGETLLKFLCQTVKQEIGDNAPYEALKAQAVCAYTYAMYHRNFGVGQTIDRNFKYQGTNVEKAVMEVLHITATNQQPHCDYISYNGKYANAVYYANCAATTTSSVNAWGGNKIPYLCGGISSPEEVMVSTYEISADNMQKLIKNYLGSDAVFDKNPARWLKILNHDGAYSNGIGYIGEIDVCGNVMSGNKFRTKVMGGDLKSHCFTIEFVL